MFGTIAIGAALLCAGYGLSIMLGRSRIATAHREARRIVHRGEVERTRLTSRSTREWERERSTAKERSGRWVAEGRRDITTREHRIDHEALRLDQQASYFERREAELEEVERQINERQKEVDKLAGKLARRRGQVKQRLIELTDRGEEELRDQTQKSIVQGIREEVDRVKTRMLEEIDEQVDGQARRIIGISIGRCRVSHNHPHFSSVINLAPKGEDPISLPEAVDLQGELGTHLGIDLVHDPEKQTLFISHADGVVREVARRSIGELLESESPDVPETVGRLVAAVDDDLVEAGGEALTTLGLDDVDPGLAATLGRLKFRTSFGQNILYHSVEVAYLCAGVAAELGMDTDKALRAGLFHDLGKALDHDSDEGHPELGARELTRYGQPEEVVRAASDHHHDPEKQPLYAALVCAADTISAARPGARRESFEQYVKRLERLEMIANSHHGVETAYAIQAGRELRVLVDPEEVDDARAKQIAAGIAQEIHSELDFPGKVRVTVIREKRVVEYAR